ncbi:MAG: hypothetical protein HYV40_02890 [Candidatus Levybacteria bacterium]|nr:hypothetical protein [Candidatus Levybacteria bacterium]
METLTPPKLSSGTPIDIDRHRSVTGIVGINGQWGVKLSRDEVISRASTYYQVPEDELRKKDLGFDCIYQTDPQLDDEAAISDEIEAAVTVGNEVIREREWAKPDVGGVIVTSGMPGINGKRKIPNYAREIADRIGLDPDIPTLNVFAACNSPAYGLAAAHEREEFQGKRILQVNVEGMTRYTNNPKRVDITSYRAFSNSVSITGYVSLVETEIHHHRHEIIPDENGVLAATMTYKDKTKPITDPKDIRQYWQVDSENNTEMIIMAEPPEGYDIWMDGMATFRFFGRKSGPFLLREMKAYMDAHPGKQLPPIFAHNPSLPVFDLFVGDLKRNEIPAPMPFLAKEDGNSSAATLGKVLHRGFDYHDGNVRDITEPGRSVIIFAYGAGGSQDFAELVFLDPNLYRDRLAA